MPTLPLELERFIFEIAALQDTDHDSRMQIILVAKRVYEWIRPILYRVAIARVTPERLTFENWPNAEMTDIAPFARHLLSLCSEGSHIINLLSTFHNVENLAIWCGGPVGLQVLKLMNDLPLRMLSIHLGETNIDEAIRYCPTLKNITHFEIISLKGSTWNDYEPLVEFPNLTHLCIDISAKVKDQVVLDLLKHCPSLRVLVYLLEGDIDVQCTIDSNDPRFLVLQDYMLLEDSIEEWESSANGQIGLWELADTILEARGDKLFKSDSPSTFSRSTWMQNLNDVGMQWYKEMVKQGRIVKSKVSRRSGRLQF